MGEFQTVVYYKKQDIAYITLNRPQRLNAYNLQMRDELYQVLSAIRDDSEVKVAVLCGAGERAFCVGADLTEFLSAPSATIARQVRWERDVWGFFLGLPQPVIAAVHGFVLGSGMEMALCCDLRIASEDAHFGLPEAGLGLIPAAGASQTLPRLVGGAKALEMLLLGDWIDAQEAYRIGLVNKVVPRGELMSAAEKLAAKVISQDNVVIRYMKEAVNRGLALPLEEGLELESRLASQALFKGRA